ncbi:hypothetical protein DSL64_25335 [Dyadobacter luteus]|uniref:Uncharacterized protein n=1 Tax=Dyadobacter luteus TaxID=2259619 RepID=A0A3D8Y4G5_9BACT|nr:hypothetical protein [Dyadobacter luteus]REA56979.1 hypothetical protein DSL64_25335 [Dyadobacter luteus]
MSTDKFLLYIDILNFRNLVKDSKEKVIELFDRIEKLPVFTDRDIRTIVFSDTIVCYLKQTPNSKDGVETMLMYLCEACEALFYHCVQLDIVYRAILTYGEFEFKEQKYFNSYFGKALIFAHDKEKEIKSIGLFVDKRVSNKYNIFRTIPYTDDFDFVYPNSDFNILQDAQVSDFPVVWYLLDGPVMLDLDVKFLKYVKHNIDTVSDIAIRQKYESVYNLYKKKFFTLIAFLEQNNFDHKAICPELPWEEKKQEFPRSMY